MLGNANEWVNDWYSAAYYTDSGLPKHRWFDNPQGPDSIRAYAARGDIYTGSTNALSSPPGSYKVFRGGSYAQVATSGTEGTHRVSYRGCALPTTVWSSYGFRVAKKN